MRANVHFSYCVPHVIRNAGHSSIPYRCPPLMPGFLFGEFPRPRPVRYTKKCFNEGRYKGNQLYRAKIRLCGL